MKPLKEPSEYGYVNHGGLLLFQKGPLSQWWMSPFRPKTASTPFNGGESEELFNCCEQFMMVAKASIMNDVTTMNKILAAKKPEKQKALGREIKNFNQALWDKHKWHAVYSANYWKFSQNEQLKNFICSFDDVREFVEVTSEDAIWGCGLSLDEMLARDPSEPYPGQNLLGKILTQVARELKTGRRAGNPDPKYSGCMPD